MGYLICSICNQNKARCADQHADTYWIIGTSDSRIGRDPPPPCRREGGGGRSRLGSPLCTASSSLLPALLGSPAKLEPGARLGDEAGEQRRQ